jgi:hypothetical protein
VFVDDRSADYGTGEVSGLFVKGWVKMKVYVSIRNFGGLPDCENSTGNFQMVWKPDFTA